MADVRYIVLSDLHFGEFNSVLTEVDNEENPDDPMIRPPFLNLNGTAEALIDCVRQLALSTDGDVKPQLILNGDIFELALGPRGRAFDVFDQFIKRLMPERDHPFDNTIIYLPGNHDHDLWDTVRDEIDIHNIETHPADGRIPGAVPITAMLGTIDDTRPMKSLGHIPLVESRLLMRLLHHRNPHLDDVRINVAYPNLGLVAGDKMAIFHHGHFLEPTYILMTQLAKRVFDDAPEVITTWDLEIDNGPWLNFFWSSLGREGPVGDSIRRSYDMLHTDVGRVLLAERLASAVVGERSSAVKRPSQWAVRTAVLRGISKVKNVQLRYDTALKPAVDEGLGSYLEGPVAAHLWFELQERGLDPPKDVTFVFGHTHQPFASRRSIGTLENDLRLYNTGGWVVDTVDAREKKGAGLVVLDDDLDAVLVHLFQQDDHLRPGTLAVDHADGPAADSALKRHVEKTMAEDPEPWNRLRREVADAIRRRRAEHRLRLDHEIDELTESTRFGIQTELLLRWAEKLSKQVKRQVRRGKPADT